MLGNAAVSNVDLAVMYQVITCVHGDRFLKSYFLLCFSEKDGEPSFYELGTDNDTVCMATGFSKYNALDKEELFSKYNQTEPTRINNEPFFDKVVILERGETCPNSTGKCAYMTLLILIYHY